MALPHYWTLWDKIPHYWTLFIVDADAIVVCYPLHDDGRQSFARPHAHSAELVLVTTKITVKRLSVNPSPIGQFLSCHCLHFSLFTFHFSFSDTLRTTRPPVCARQSHVPAVHCPLRAWRQWPAGRRCSLLSLPFLLFSPAGA